MMELHLTSLFGRTALKKRNFKVQVMLAYTLTKPKVYSDLPTARLRIASASAYLP